MNMNPLVKRFKALPRSMKWLIWTLLLVGAYFGVIEPVLEMTNAARARADALAADLRREQALTSTDSEQGRVLESGRRAFGEPLLPEDPANRPEALHTVVDAILAKHGIGNRVKIERKVRLTNEDAAELLGPLSASSGVERLILDLTFEASPEVVTAIISDFEQAPEVAAVSRVEIRRQDAVVGRTGTTSSSGARIVKATISPEAWILTRTAGSGIAGGSLR